jgi:DNA polymerase I
MSSSSPQLLLIDGHSLAFRSFYAYAKNKDGGMKTNDGIPTSICFGFLKSLLEIVNAYHPEYLAVAFDLPNPTFRHELDTNYKGNRQETPADFIPDIQNLYSLLAALNIPMVTAVGYEADDVLGTLAARASSTGYQVKIASGDKDMFQLVNDRGQVSVLYFSGSPYQRSSGGPALFNEQAVFDKMAVRPDQIVDYKALCGDPSDCIPGVRGIGAKSAAPLLQEFDTLDGVYTSIDQIKGSKQIKLKDGKESAYHSQYLAKIVTDVSLAIDLADTKLQGFSAEQVLPILEKLELQKFIKDIHSIAISLGSEKNSAASQPLTTAQSLGINDQEDDDDIWFFSAADELNAPPPLQKIFLPLMLVDTEEKLQELVAILVQQQDLTQPVAWDTETTGLIARDVQLVGLGCCWGVETQDVAYIPINHVAGKNLSQELVFKYLRSILEGEQYPKVLQNAKFDRLILRHQGINLAGVVADTMLASYVLNPDQKNNLTDLAKRYLRLDSTSYKDLVPKNQTIANIDIPSVAQYCGMDVYATRSVYFFLQAALHEHPTLLKLWQSIEMPLEPVLADIEDLGIRIDVEYLASFSQQLATELGQIEQQAYAAAGSEFNMASPKQMAELMFEQLGLPTKGIRKTQSGLSTDAQTLEKLQGQHPVVDLILQHRTLSKLKSTYTDALPKLVHPQTGRVHTDFNQAVTSTGRLSSSEPNLQNIPIRTEFSRQLRQAFLPKAGWIMVTADYSQIELRILAHFSQEPVLVQAYQQQEDIHAVTARLLFEKSEISKEERRLGKIINFGVIYGMGTAKFAREANVTNAVGKEFIEKYYDRYAGIFRYLEEVKKQVLSQGYVETICGRRRYFNFESGRLRRFQGVSIDQINLADLGKVSNNDASILRQAANAPIQGSSADIIKIAMIKLHQLLQNYQANMLLQVHDELVFEMPLTEWAELQPQIQQIMENALSLNVPLRVEIGQGSNWMAAK